MHCEFGIDFQNITNTFCLGLIENTEWLKPELVFVSKLNFKKAEVLECAKQAEEGFEYTEMTSFAANHTGVSSFLDEYRQQCTPSAEGCLELYRKHLQRMRGNTSVAGGLVCHFLLASKAR